MAEKKSKSGTEYHLQKLSNYFTQPVILEKNQSKTGVIGWLGLVGVIVLYDAYAIKSKKIETLTRSFWRHTENKTGQSIFIGAWLGLTFHLLFEKMIRKKISNRDLV